MLPIITTKVQGVSEGVHSADVVINILARQRDPGPAATILTLCACAALRSPIAPDTISLGARDDGANRSPGHDGAVSSSTG